jgi:hypothetical protein
VTSHLQKRLSNCHCPCKKGFSDKNILFNMKHFMYLKILEVFRHKYCLWHDCMSAQTQTQYTVFYFHFAASFFLHFIVTHHHFHSMWCHSVPLLKKVWTRIKTITISVQSILSPFLNEQMYNLQQKWLTYLFPDTGIITL